MLLVRSAGRDDPDLVLCSLNLDDDGSLRLLSQFRAHEATRHLPILMVGEEDQTDKLAKALDLGANDYLMKPVDRNELLARVRTQIRRRRYQERLRENYEQSLSRSEEHTSELQSLMRISYAVFCLNKKTTKLQATHTISL